MQVGSKGTCGFYPNGQNSILSFHLAQKKISHSRILFTGLGVYCLL